MMKRTFLTLCLIVAITSSTVCAEETIRLATGEWSPYTSENLKYSGVVSRIVTEAFALQGVKAEIEILPWGRAMAVAVEGESNGTFPWFYNTERAKNLLISDEVMSTKYVFFHLKSYPFEWNTFDDLIGVDIGATVEWFYGKKFESAEKTGKISVERAPSLEINFRKLLGGRIHIFPSEPHAGYSLLNKSFNIDDIRKLTFHPKEFHNKSLHLMLSKKNQKNKQMLKLFNQGLKQLKESGRYARYFEESKKGDYVIKK